MYRLGACVRRARLQARFGSPTPTKTTSPSRSSRAELMVINSAAVYSMLVFSIVNHGCRAAGHAQARVRFFPQLLPVGFAIRHAIHPFLQVCLQRFICLAELIPFQVKVVIPVIISLGIGGM